MKFNVYGRMLLEVKRHQESWVVYYLGNEGKKRLAHDVQLPPDLAEQDIQEQLAVLFHEYATHKHQDVVLVP